MNTIDSVLVRVQGANPVADVDLHDWSSSPEARRLLDRVVGSNIGAFRPPRHRARWVAGAAVVTAAMGTVAAASGVIGEPAPDSIRANLAAVDNGMPQALRVNPDVDHAIAVASSADGVLYATALNDGGYCLEIATDGDRPRGAVCVTASHIGDRAIEVTAPIPTGPDAALLVGGRVNDPAVTGVVARYPDGTSQDVGLGSAGYWLLQVPDASRDSVLGGGLDIVGVGAGGEDLSKESVPALRDDDPDGTAHDRVQPIFVSTMSSGGDLTLVLGIEGFVTVDGASTVELQYPDGTTVPVAVAADGSYHVELPADRQHDFATLWGKLVARDADGTILASVAFSSVANTERGTTTPGDSSTPSDASRPG